MNKEQFIAEGKVIDMINNVAHIALTTDSACSSCGANTLCFSKSSDKIFKIPFSGSTRIGDTVSIYESENILLKLSFYQYGLPFSGFLAGIFISYLLTPQGTSEFFYALCGGVGLVLSSFYARNLVAKLADRKQSLFMFVKESN